MLSCWVSPRLGEGFEKKPKHNKQTTQRCWFLNTFKFVLFLFAHTFWLSWHVPVYTIRPPPITCDGGLIVLLDVKVVGMAWMHNIKGLIDERSRRIVCVWLCSRSQTIPCVLLPKFVDGTGSELIEISIHKPCTDSCGGLKIEPVTIEKHVDSAFPIFERILLFCLQSLFFARSCSEYPCVC